MSSATGEFFYDHYLQYLGAPIGREVFEGTRVHSRLQVLFFEGVFPDCMVFATLGFSKHPQEGQLPVEVVVAVDEGFVDVPRLLSNALYFLLERTEPLRRGTLVGGVRAIAPKFALAFGKSALYFTNCFGFPSAFGKIVVGGTEVGEVLAGLFISSGEESLLRTEGARALESALERQAIDPFHLRRPSAAGQRT